VIKLNPRKSKLPKLNLEDDGSFIEDEWDSDDYDLDEDTEYQHGQFDDLLP